MIAPHTVVLAGGPRLYQSALVTALGHHDDLQVLAEVDDAAGAGLACARLRPTVALVDSVRGGVRALQACTAVKGASTRTAVLLTSETEDPDLLLRAVEAGIDGFASREDTLDDLIEALRTVASGRAHIPPPMLGLLLRNLIERRREEEQILRRISTLTKREREVVALMVAGRNRDAIARELVVSPETARTHIQRVLSKLGVHSQIEAAALVSTYDSALRFSRSGAES